MFISLSLCNFHSNVCIFFSIPTSAIYIQQDTGEPWDEEKGSLHDLDSELLTLRQHVEKLGSSSDGAGLRESIRSLRCELKRRISDEQVRQSGLLDQIK